MARALTPSEAAAALRRGAELEQFVSLDDGVVHYFSAWPSGSRFVLVEHRVHDVGSANYLDISSFPTVDEDEETGEGRQVLVADEAEEVVARVRRHGGSQSRWKNHGLAADDYWSAKVRSGL